MDALIDSTKDREGIPKGYDPIIIFDDDNRQGRRTAWVEANGNHWLIFRDDFYDVWVLWRPLYPHDQQVLKAAYEKQISRYN